MKAVVLHEYGGPEKLKFEDNVPDPQISGDTVLIAAAAASVNPIDWKLRSGMRRKDFPLSFPAILGRDVSGGFTDSLLQQFKYFALLNVTGAAPATITGYYTIQGYAGPAALEFGSGNITSMRQRNC